MPQLKFFAGFIIVLLLASCGSNKNKEKPAELVKFESTVSLKKNWSSSAGSGQKKRSYIRFYSVIEEGVLYTSDEKGKVFALNADTGKKLWSVDTDTTITGALSVSDSRLFFGTADAQVIALSTDDGKELWRASVSSEVLAPPASSDVYVVAQTSDGRLFAFDSITGEQKWKFDHQPSILSLRTTSAPIILGSQVIAAFDNGQVVSVALSDGSTLWTTRVAQPKGRSELERIVDIDGRPIVSGDLIYVASYQGNIVAINRAQGNVVWKKLESSFHNLDVDASSVYSVSDRSKVVARNLYTGDSVWENSQLTLRNVSAPAAFGDYVAVVDYKDYLHLLSKADGSFAYRFKPAGDRFTSPMMVYKDNLIILSDDGELSSYRIKPTK